MNLTPQNECIRLASVAFLDLRALGRGTLTGFTGKGGAVGHAAAGACDEQAQWGTKGGRGVTPERHRTGGCEHPWGEWCRGRVGPGPGGYDNHPTAYTCCPRSIMSRRLPAQAQRPRLIPREDSTPNKSRPPSSVSSQEALGRERTDLFLRNRLTRAQRHIPRCWLQMKKSQATQP